MSALIRWTPFLEPFEDMDKMFNDFMPSNMRGMQSGYLPAIDLYEDKNNVIVEAQLAGIEPEKVDISIEKDVLTIKGESEQKSEVEDKNYYRKEIRRGGFFRTIPLPAHVLGDQASALAEDGVLKISIPKAPETLPKKVKIETRKK
jgi:HSP20 family protein